MHRMWTCIMRCIMHARAYMHECAYMGAWAHCACICTMFRKRAVKGVLKGFPLCKSPFKRPNPRDIPFRGHYPGKGQFRAISGDSLRVYVCVRIRSPGHVLRSRTRVPGHSPAHVPRSGMCAAASFDGGNPKGCLHTCEHVMRTCIHVRT